MTETAEDTLGAGQDASQQTDRIAGKAEFPIDVTITNDHTRPVVLAQATPSIFLRKEESTTYTCHTRGHLYDLVFGMIAIGDQLGQDKIGRITTVNVKPNKGAPKK